MPGRARTGRAPQARSPVKGASGAVRRCLPGSETPTAPMTLLRTAVGRQRRPSGASNRLMANRDDYPEVIAAIVARLVSGLHHDQTLTMATAPPRCSGP